MKSKKEIDNLIQDWIQDPSWELECTPGFEDHRDELREAAEQHLQKERIAHKQDVAQKLNIPLHLVDEYERQIRTAELDKARANRLLTHYLSQALPACDSDALQEIESIADNIISSAISSITAKFIVKSNQLKSWSKTPQNN